MSAQVLLEKEAQDFVDLTANPPYLFDIGPEQGRALLDEVQSGAIDKPAADISDLAIAGGPTGDVQVRIVRPQTAARRLPVIVYLHGGGWVIGNAHSHDRLVRELAVGAGAAVVFPEYSLSPEAKYPTAVEECFAVLQWVAQRGEEQGLDTQRVAVAGDSAGGNLAAALALLAHQRGGPDVALQLLFYPVTDAAFGTPSYEQFATGYFLRRDAMQWFWDQYTTTPAQRAEITASPLRATLDQLRSLPPALIVTAEADVLRDEGEAYANKLRRAGVQATAARFQGTIHDFVMLNGMASSAASRAALVLATGWLRAGLAN